MSLTVFNNKIVELEKSVKRSKVRSIRKLTRQIENERKKSKSSEDERSKRKIQRLIDEIHQIRKMSNKDVVLFAMENEGTISEVLRQIKPPSDDLKQHSLIRLATEKSLQADLIKMKNSEDFSKSWRQLLIMYRSRYEKKVAWKEKSEDFHKIEKALEEQQNELDEIESKLPKPLTIKKKKEKSVVKRPKSAVVCVLDLENRTAEPLGENLPIENDEEETTQVEISAVEPEKNETFVINDPFFVNSQHQITYQKRTTRDKNDVELDDKRFIEQSYFIEALSSSSNRRDGGGDFARKKWAHLDLPQRPKPNGSTRNFSSKIVKKTEETGPLHPSWEASKQAKNQYRIQKSEAKKIVFNDDEM